MFQQIFQVSALTSPLDGRRGNICINRICLLGKPGIGLLPDFSLRQFDVHEIGGIFIGEENRTAQRNGGQRSDDNLPRGKLCIGNSGRLLGRFWFGCGHALRLVCALIRGLKTAVFQIQHNGHNQRDEHNSGSNTAGYDIVSITTAEQEKCRIQGIDRIVPDQGRNDPEAEHQDADNNPGDTHFHSPDIKGLVGISGVTESPDQGGDHNGQPSDLQKFFQERNREHPGHKLFRNGREESHQQHEDPGDSCIQEIRIGDISRRPGAEFRRNQVEYRLICHKKDGGYQSDDNGDEKTFGANAAESECPVETKFFAVSFPVKRFRCRCQGKDPSTGKQCLKNS